MFLENSEACKKRRHIGRWPGYETLPTCRPWVSPIVVWTKTTAYVRPRGLWFSLVLFHTENIKTSSVRSADDSYDAGVDIIWIIRSPGGSNENK